MVVNHSSAAVQVVSAWELGRDELLPSGARQGYFRGSAIYAETQGSCLPNPQESERHSFSWWSPQGEGARSPGRTGPAAPWRYSHLSKKSTSEPGQPWEDYSNSLILVLVLLHCKTEMKIVASRWSCCED